MEKQKEHSINRNLLDCGRLLCSQPPRFHPASIKEDDCCHIKLKCCCASVQQSSLTGSPLCRAPESESHFLIWGPPWNILWSPFRKWDHIVPDPPLDLCHSGRIPASLHETSDTKRKCLALTSHRSVSTYRMSTAEPPPILLSPRKTWCTSQSKWYYSD